MLSECYKHLRYLRNQTIIDDFGAWYEKGKGSRSKLKDRLSGRNVLNGYERLNVSVTLDLFWFYFINDNVSDVIMVASAA